MTAHMDADDYVGFEHAEYAHLHRSRLPDIVCGVALLSRAYTGSAATRYGVRVDLGEITAGMSLGKADRRVIRTARRVLNNVHAQRMRGTRVDDVEHAKALDGTLARLKTQHAGG